MKEKTVSVQKNDDHSKESASTRIINGEIKDFNHEFSVPDSFSTKAYIIARAEYQSLMSLLMSSELGEVGEYIRSRYYQKQPEIDIVIKSCPSIWIIKDGRFCLSPKAVSFGKNHNWEESINSTLLTMLWGKTEKAKTLKGDKVPKPSGQKDGSSLQQLVVTRLGELILGETVKRLTNAEDIRDDAEMRRAKAENLRVDAEIQRSGFEKQRETTDQQRSDDEAKRVKAETKREEAEKRRETAEQQRKDAEEARQSEVQRICSEAQDATNKALRAAEEAHQAADAIHGSVIEGLKIQSVSETSPMQGNANRPRWENLPEDPQAEKTSIIAFYEALKNAGWQYSLRDIVRFHTSVRCEPLTILGGAPGSGKSSLARMYASYFGLGETKRFLTVDVQPSWHDRMDFLGFVKTHGDKGEFVDAETGVAQFLRDADADASPNGLWLACLEEINLARPEHYFSDFLQRISLDDFTRAKTPIEFKGLSEKEAGKGSFTLVPSVRFVGTCNFDETTQSFSARFLDRCNYIELQPIPLQTMFFPERNIASEITFQAPKWLWRPFSSSSRTKMDDRKEEVNQLLDKLAPKGENRKGVLAKLGISPSPRVVNDIIRYVEARLDTTEKEFEDERKPGVSPSADDLFSRALDEALLQRILPKMIVVQSGFPNSDTDDIRKNLKEMLSPASNDIKLHLCNRFLEKLKSIW